MRLITMTLSVLATATFAGNMNADDTPKRSAELQVLERFIGTWDTVLTNKNTGKKSNTIERRKWSRKGHFILSEDFDSSANKEAHFLITYDTKGKLYRGCWINENITSTLLGTWDEENDSMKWDGTDSFGNKLATTHRFITKDRVEWSTVVTNPDGKVVFEADAKQTRRKK
jgi:hypothetical protein